MHSGHTGFRRTRPHTSRDGFVICKRLTGSRVHSTDSQIVHSSRSGRRNTFRQSLRQCAKQHIHDALRGFHVPTRNRCRRTRIHHCPCRSKYANGTHQSGGRRYIFNQQTPEYIETCGIRNGLDRINAAFHLRIAPSKIHNHHACVARAPPPAFWGTPIRSGTVKRDPRHNLHRLITDPVIIQKILCAISSLRHALQKRPHHFFGIFQQLARRSLNSPQPINSTNFSQSLRSDVTSGDLCAEIPFALVRSANVIEQQRENITIHFSGSHDGHWRNPQSFLVNFAAKPHGSRIRATDISVVGPRCNIEVRPAALPREIEGRD